MKNINLFIINSVAHLVTPDNFKEVTINSPANTIFIDFKKFKPLIIDENTKAI